MHFEEDDEEPANESFELNEGIRAVGSNPRAPAPRQARASYLSPMASSRARHVAAAMQELSQQQPEDQ